MMSSICKHEFQKGCFGSPEFCIKYFESKWMIENSHY